MGMFQVPRSGPTADDEFEARAPRTLDRAVARHPSTRRGRRDGAGPAGDEVLRCGDVVIDVAAHQASAGGVALPLSHLQFVLLVHLVRNADRVVPAEELARLARDLGPTRPRTIASAVSRLRSHLGSSPERPIIDASRLRGYRLTPPP